MNVYRVKVVNTGSPTPREVVSLIVASEHDRAIAKGISVFRQSYRYAGIASVTSECLGSVVKA